MSITNFRDIGGYATCYGRVVKQGCFYRSGPIIFKNEKEREEFAALGVRTILDLRSVQEREAVPDEQMKDSVYIPCSAIPEDNMGGGNFDLVEMIKTGEISKLEYYVEAIYKGLPFQNKAYQTLFDILRREETPVVFHCSAGKDRTGFAAYLILKTLGVPDKTIMEDYMLSNIYRREENEKVLKQFPKAAEAEGLLYVKETYLQSSMEAIAEKYSDFETYLNAEYGVTREEVIRIRERYSD